MKTLFKVLAVIVFLVAAGTSLLVGVRNSYLKEKAPSEADIKQLKENYESLKALAKDGSADATLAELDKAIKEAEGFTASKFDISNVLALVVAVFCLVAIVFVFVKGGKLILIMGSVTIGLAVVSWMMAVNVPSGSMGGANPKNVALTALIMVVAAAAFGFLGKKPAANN